MSLTRVLIPKTSLVIDELLSGITKEFNMTTIINTHDMNSVMGIGENICFIYKGQKEWQGNKDQVMSSTNEKLNDLVFASDLFRKVKEVEMKKITNTECPLMKKALGLTCQRAFFINYLISIYLIFHSPFTSTIGTTICSLVLSP